jgi:hypothetical protein
MNRMASILSSRWRNIGVLLACLITLMAILEIARAQSGGRSDGQTINFVKGGAITGRVIDPNGEPVIGIEVNDIMIRDADGNALQFRFSGQRAFTDDRGVYRLYGLRPGSYIVAANWHKYDAGISSRYHGEATVFYPSSTIDTAVEIAVASGSEATGVDILYPGEPGRVVSGKVIAAGDSGRLLSGMSVWLVSATTGIVVGSTLHGYSNNEGYAIYGVPDGEYDVITGGGNHQPRRITVKGADLTGVD